MSLMKRLMAAKMNPKPLTLPVSAGPMKLKIEPGKVLAVREPLPPLTWRKFEELPLPPPLSPPVPTSAPAPAVARGSCKCINAETGRQCALLAGHPPPHRHGSTSFVRVAEAGATSFARRDALDAAASRTHSSAFTTPQE